MHDYARRFGLLRDPRVADEIARLDAARDCQRIARLLAVYEFPWDLQRSLELALLYTFGSASVARVLAATRQFERHGQKRYDDTQLLINRFVESGWDGEYGRRAIARMNEIHARYAIANDDFLFVLWTFIDFPLRWARDFAWRPFTDHEARAWFHFWRGVGARMHIAALPETYEDFAAFVASYEREQFVPGENPRRVAEATMNVLREMLPAPLRPAVRPVAVCLMPERLRLVLGEPPPSRALLAAVRAALRARARIERQVPLSAYPVRFEQVETRTYGAGAPPPESLGPDRASPRAS